MGIARKQVFLFLESQLGKAVEHRYTVLSHCFKSHPAGLDLGGLSFTWFLTGQALKGEETGRFLL